MSRALLVTASFFIFILGSGAAPDLKRKFQASAGARDKFSVACRAYRAELAQVAGCKGGMCDKFSDRATAVRVLEKLRLHPETPKSIRESHSLFVKHESSLLKADWITYYAPLYNEYCALPTVNSVTKRLIESRKVYSFNDDEIRILKEHVLNFARTELSYPSGILTSRTVLELLKELTASEILVKNAIPLDDLTAEVEKVRVELKDSELEVLRGEYGGLRLVWNDYRRTTPVRERILKAVQSL